MDHRYLGIRTQDASQTPKKKEIRHSARRACSLFVPRPKRLASPDWSFVASSRILFMCCAVRSAHSAHRRVLPSRRPKAGSGVLRRHPHSQAAIHLYQHSVRYETSWYVDSQGSAPQINRRSAAMAVPLIRLLNDILHGSPRRTGHSASTPLPTPGRHDPAFSGLPPVE